MCGEDLREKNGPRQITPTPVNVARTSEDLCHVRFGPQPENNVPSMSKRGSRRHSRNSFYTALALPVRAFLHDPEFGPEFVEYVMLDVPRSRPIFNMPNLSFNSLVLSSYWSTA